MSLLKSISVKGLLSYKDVSLDLRPLNVLIGPNASGKSNLIEVINLLQATPRDLSGFVRRSGGISEWLWKGLGQGAEGQVEVLVNSPSVPMNLRYALSITTKGQQLDVASEVLETERPFPGHDEPYFYFRLRDGFGHISIYQSPETEGKRESPRITPDDVTAGQSILRERRDPTLYPQVSFVSGRFEDMRMYREWNLGRGSEIRRPQPTDASPSVLDEDFGNLALVLNNLKTGLAFKSIHGYLARFYELYEQIDARIEANTAQLWMLEKGLASSIPATRLSDGTLRFLALLAILCDPKPPPLICLEEPELGLHPEIVSVVAELLKKASEKTQLVVTTHSERMINELSDDPESVIVCERTPENGTELTRLSNKKLGEWLERYQLGELWTKGEIGGTRW